MAATTSSMMQPALFGGLVMGVLSALPIVQAGNLCCCLWIITGGLAAAYLLQQREPAPITPGDGALVGLLAGIIGAFIGLVIAIPITFITGPMGRMMAQRVLENSGNMPPAVRDALERFSTGDVRMSLAMHVVNLIVTLVLGAIFSTLGGLLGAVFFRKPQPPTVIDVPPSP